MSIVGGTGHLTISFHPTASSSHSWPSDRAPDVYGRDPIRAPAPLTLPDLTAVLDALQRAIYTAAAHERHLPGIRNLSDDDRRHHTLALLGLHAGDTAFDLAPLSAFAQETAPTLFPPEELERIARDSATRVLATAARAVTALAAHFGDQPPPQHDALAAQISRYAVTTAAVALRSGQTIRLHVADVAYEAKVEAGYENSLRVLALAAVERGELQRYPDCIVRDVLTSQPVLYVEIPEYDDALVRCEYPSGPELDYAWSLHAGDQVALLGTPQWPRRQGKAGVPDVIEVAAILDTQGRIVGHPILHHLLKETANDLLAP